MTVDEGYDAILADERASARRIQTLVAFVVIAFVASLWQTGFFDARRLMDSDPARGRLFEEMVPPDFTRLPAWLKPLADTLAMSIAGTTLSVLITRPLALRAAKNTTPHCVVYPVSHTDLSAPRSVP